MREYYKRGRKVKGKGMKGMSIGSGDKRPTKSGAGMTAKGVATVSYTHLTLPTKA